ncbi:23S rRNA (guanosine(2251)-2'-O)-methyltransferase RlmB [Candidatus Hepatoplasma crinochetorum]|uniref:23S rRNA (Guanosine-2'-O-)-methyltransferase RlmB n=1 Tax=Candidatus Hepatoplasma crinochetorum Av TaxID=1427984 RepID=W8GNK8_9MOLU|nr:23S rRNA (guanosine(2251)-2'-O)-methyltransferase RlmB [Candidatus Hepatoplasma crinochetorum]AHK22611.1 23S rRNA (guanosine-2'-O-)-methyltransferase RlmB [Candidatus Hepatoplasma crinochetorum Av]BDV03192.1 MAG: 23S rRNA (guanosine(2251)-2'-O)-methyltransferase RlmB [Candidatus Hepatoplasma crinochetorum]
MQIYGINSVKEIFYKRRDLIKKVYLDKNKHFSFYQELEQNDINVLKFDFHYWKKRFPEIGNFQSIIAEIDLPNQINLDQLISKIKNNKNPILLFLDRIQDPQNLGAIIRNAVAFNVDGILITKDNSAKLTNIAMKASAGTWLDIDILTITSSANVIKKLKNNNFWIVSTTLDGKYKPSELKKLKQKLVLIFGNEGKGIRSSLINSSDYTSKINIDSKVESLNVSSSVGIFLYALTSDN